MRGLRGLFYRWLYFSLPLRRCGAITAISETTRDVLIARFPATQSKIRVIPDCYPAEYTHHPRRFNSQRPVILQVGTRPGKNLEGLAEALRSISCRLNIVGAVSTAQANLLRQCGVDFQSAVNLTDEQMLKAYIDSDLVVFASHAEGFGMPIIEAQATGRPLAVSKLQPMAGIAGRGACLVDPFDPADMRRGILELIRNEGYREGVVAAGLLNAQDYTAQAVAALYADLYHKVLSSAAATSNRPTVPAGTQKIGHSE
jgi:glycosyltransferase involved in cell wall biosynthesis